MLWLFVWPCAIGFPSFRITLCNHGRATIKHSGTLGRNKLPLNSTSRPAPTGQLTRARIDEPLLISRHLCSIWMGFGGGFITLPDSQTASKVAQILYLGYFSSCVKVPVSRLPSVLGRWKLREWVVNQQCFSKCMQALIIRGRALF